MESDSYSLQEVQKILEIALAQTAQSDNFSRQQLLEMARDLGISEKTLLEAEQKWQQQFRQQQAQHSTKRTRYHKLRYHLFAYLAVNTFLVIIDLMKDGTLDWAYWPILGWGLTLAFQAFKTFEPAD